MKDTKWIIHIRNFAKENNITFGCALSNPKISQGYVKKEKISKKTKKTKKTKQNTDKEELEVLNQIETPLENQIKIKKVLSQDEDKQLKILKKYIEKMNQMKKIGINFNEDQRGSIEEKIKKIQGDGLFSKKTEQYTPKVEKILKENGSKKIMQIFIKRTPLNWIMKKTLNIVSMGLLKKRMEENNIDELFHLFMEVVLENGTKITIEKNERIDMNINAKIRTNTEIEKIDNINKQINLNELMENTKEKMGIEKYFNYSAKNNNCSDFLLNILNANDIGSQKDKNFIKQDAKTLFGKSTFLRKFVNTTTDIAGKITDIIGNGIKKTNKWIDHIKNYAKENNMTYACALGDPGCKDSYKKMKEEKSTPEKKISTKEIQERQKKAEQQTSNDKFSKSLLDELDNENTFPILVYQTKSLKGFVDKIQNIIKRGVKIVPGLLFQGDNSFLNSLFTYWTEKIGVIEAIKKIDKGIRSIVQYFDGGDKLPEQINYNDYLKPLNAKNKKILYDAINKMKI